MSQQMSLDTAIEFMSHPDLELRKAAMSGVVKAGLEALPFLINELENEDGMRREIAVSLLFQIQENNDINDPKLISSLARLIESELNPVNQGDAAGLLGRIYWASKDDKVFYTLLGLLESKNTEAQEAAADVLGELHDSRAIEPIINLLSQNVLPLTLTALESLGRLKAESAIEYIVPLLTTGQNVHSGQGVIWMRDSLAQVAVKTLKTIGSQKALEIVEGWENK